MVILINLSNHFSFFNKLSQIQTDFGNVQKENCAQRLHNDGTIPRSRVIIFHSRVAARRISAGGFPRSERRAESARKREEKERKEEIKKQVSPINLADATPPCGCVVSCPIFARSARYLSRCQYTVARERLFPTKSDQSRSFFV